MATIDMNTYKMIRRLHAVEHLSQRKIAEQLGISRNTVRRYCEGAFHPEQKTLYQTEKSPLRTVLEAEILKMFEEHKTAPKKQRINGKIICQHLNLKGYQIGESTVRKYIQELRIERPEIFIPLEFEPGEAMEFDWGDVYAFIKNVKTRVSVFCAVLPYSYGIFCAVFPDKTYTSFFTGHVMAFSYFEGVPKRCIYDNLKSAVLEGFGKNAVKQERFKKLEAHYAFESVFCNIASGWEKGSVENLVSIIRKIAFIPMPVVNSFEELQEHVLSRCHNYCMTHQIKGRSHSIKEMLEEEKKHLLKLPMYPLDADEETKAMVHSDLTVRLNAVKYSVPMNYVGLYVTIKISPFHVTIYHDGKLVYKHRKGTHSLDHQYIPEHYLEILVRKPRAIKQAVPINQGVMPKELSEFMRLCKNKDRNQQFVDIMLLGIKLDNEDLLWAVKQANLSGSPSYDLVCFYLEIQNESLTVKPSIDDDLTVKQSDFKAFDDLI